MQARYLQERRVLLLGEMVQLALLIAKLSLVSNTGCVFENMLLPSLPSKRAGHVTG